MKDKLTHEVELLGRSVSVLLIAGLLVVGGASAALLNSFGTIDGEADVDQAVEFVDGDIDEVFEDDVYAGATVVSEERTLQSNTEAEATVEFVTTLSNEDKDLDTVDFDVSDFEQASADITWAEDGDYAFTTQVVNTFPEAGADYEGAPSGDVPDVTIDDSEDEEVTLSEYDGDEVEDGHTVVVESDLESLKVDVENVEVHSDEETVEHIRIEADDVEVAGFAVKTDGEEEGNGITLSDPLDDVMIRDNKLEDLKRGVIVTGTKAEENYPVDAEIKNNDFIDNHVGVSQASSDDLEISDNVFEGHDVEAIGSVPDWGSPTVEHNRFSDNAASVQVYVDGTLTADNNFFAEGFNTAVDDDADDSAEVKASYSTHESQVTFTEEGEEVGVAVVYDFPLTLTPDVYDITTDVQPVTAE